MKLNKIQLESFVEAELKTYDLTDLFIDTEKAREEIRDELLDELDDLNSENTKNARLEHFKVKGAIREDYSEKLINLSGGKALIYGVRNIGGKPEIPFIKLRANFDITSKEESLVIYEHIKEEFKVFKPLYLSFSTAKKIDADFYGAVHMATRTSELTEKKWQKEESLTFEDISDESYFDWYQQGYKEFHKDAPDLEAKVTINSLSVMEDSLKQGLLKFVKFEDERIGLIAGEKSNFLGNSAVYFNEIYISKKWKGRGLAKAIQRKFVQEFCGNLDFVWGTIDASNLPSYKTALSNSRKPIRHECFINLK